MILNCSGQFSDLYKSASEGSQAPQHSLLERFDETCWPGVVGVFDLHTGIYAVHNGAVLGCKLLLFRRWDAWIATVGHSLDLKFNCRCFRQMQFSDVFGEMLQVATSLLARTVYHLLNSWRPQQSAVCNVHVDGNKREVCWPREGMLPSSSFFFLQIYFSLLRFQGRGTTLGQNW